MDQEDLRCICDDCQDGQCLKRNTEHGRNDVGNVIADGYTSGGDGRLRGECLGTGQEKLQEDRRLRITVAVDEPRTARLNYMTSCKTRN
jgi:hypothetical protein